MNIREAYDEETWQLIRDFYAITQGEFRKLARDQLSRLHWLAILDLR